MAYTDREEEPFEYLEEEHEEEAGSDVADPEPPSNDIDEKTEPREEEEGHVLRPSEGIAINPDCPSFVVN